MQVYYTQKSTCLHTNSQHTTENNSEIYGLRSLHVGDGLFQFPL